MGRVKLKIQCLETANARQVTYSKRRAGLTKKASELSILCDIDVVLVMFSPSGKPNVCLGVNNDLAAVLDRFSRVPLQERLKRKLEVLEVLKKVFRKLDHTVDVQRLMGDGKHKIEELNNQKQFLLAQIQEKNQKLSYWTKPDDVEDMARITLMEESLVASINRLQKRKAHLSGKRCNNSWTASQPQRQRLTWVPEHLIAEARLRGDPNFATSQRDFGCLGNRSGRNAENAGRPGLQLGCRYAQQQPGYNMVGFDHHPSRVGVDLNQTGPCYNHIQQVDPSSSCYDPSLRYHM